MCYLLQKEVGLLIISIDINIFLVYRAHSCSLQSVFRS